MGNDASSTQPSVVTYRPNGVIGTIVWLLVFVGAFGLTFGGAITALRSVHLRCDHASGSCDIVTTWPLGKTTHQSIAIASIHGTRLEAFKSKHSTDYSVVLVTDAGDVQLPGSAGGKSRRAEQKAAIDEFLGKTSAPAIDVDYEDPDGAANFLFPFSFVWLLVGWMFTWYTRVEIDWQLRRIVVLRKRWPIAPKIQMFPLDSVRDAIVQTTRGSKGSIMYSVALVVDGSEAPVNIGARSSGRGAKDKAVAEIRTLLLRRDEMNARVG